MSASSTPATTASRREPSSAYLPRPTPPSTNTSTEPHLRGYLSGEVWARSSWRWFSGLDIKYAEALAPAQSRLDLDRDSSERLLGAAPPLDPAALAGLRLRYATDALARAQAATT